MNSAKGQTNGVALLVPEDAAPLSAERRARVWLWLSILADCEVEDRTYEWPRQPDRDAEIERLEASSEACRTQAARIVPEARDPEFYAWAYRSFYSVDPSNSPETDPLRSTDQ